jgi:hypothetical protein
MTGNNPSSEGNAAGSNWLVALIRSIPPGRRLAALALIVVGLGLYLLLQRERTDPKQDHDRPNCDISASSNRIETKGDNNTTNLGTCTKDPAPKP